MKRLLLSLFLLTTLLATAYSNKASAACTVPYVSGTSIFNCSGKLLVMRGVSQPSALNNLSGWNNGKRPATDVNSPLDLATINAMSSAHMNFLRVPVSAYIYNLDPTTYLSQLDTIVSNTLTPTIYVAFALFDDAQSGSPYTPDNQWHSEDATFVGVLAQHFASKTRVFYDLLNEPSETSWTQWNTDMVAGINAVRQYSSQIIMLEPTHGAGSPGCVTGAGLTIKAQFNGLTTNLMPTDANTVYEPHMYNAMVNGDAQSWQCEAGPAYGNHPLYVGEWGALPHANIPYNCQNLTSTNATSVTNTFMDWTLTGNNGAKVYWTAWDFEPTNMISDQYVTYTPTVFTTGTWVCDDGSTASLAAGMGNTVESWLNTH